VHYKVFFCQILLTLFSLVTNFFFSLSFLVLKWAKEQGPLNNKFTLLKCYSRFCNANVLQIVFYSFAFKFFDYVDQGWLRETTTQYNVNKKPSCR